MDELLIKGAWGAARAFAEHTGMFDNFTDSLLVSDAPSGGVVQAVFKPEEQAGTALELASATDATVVMKATTGDSVCVGTDKCVGAIKMFMRLGMSESEATEMAIKTGMYDPDELHNDPHWRESASILKGDCFEKLSDGTIRVTRDGEVIVLVDKNGNVVDRFGNTPSELMIDAEKCEFDDYQEEPVAAPAPAFTEQAMIENPYDAEVQTVVLCNVQNQCFTFGNMLSFDSVEEAKVFMSDPDRAEWYRKSIKALGYPGSPFVIISDGEGSAQCLPMRGDKLVTDKIFALQLKTPDGKLLGHMPDGEIFDQYFRGNIGTDGPRSAKGLEFEFTEGETLFPSTPQKLIMNPETGLYEYEPFETSVINTMNGWLTDAGIDRGEWELLKSMSLPVEFADPTANVAERTMALVREARKAGVTLDTASAERLTRIITEGQGVDAGLHFDELFKKAGITVPATQNGSMVTMEKALGQTAVNGTQMLRALQGFSPR